MSRRCCLTIYRPPVRIIDFIYIHNISIIDQEWRSAWFSALMFVNHIFMHEYQFPCIERLLSLKRKCKISVHFLRNNNSKNKIWVTVQQYKDNTVINGVPVVFSSRQEHSLLEKDFRRMAAEPASIATVLAVLCGPFSACSVPTFRAPSGGR